MSETTTFLSGREQCAAWITTPDGSAPAPYPVVVLVHGGGAVHDMKLPAYEAAFAAAGFAVVAFDYRHFGDSGGTPRQVFSIRRQQADVEAALAFVASRPDLDATRVALWGTSFGAGHVLAVAARRPELAAAVIQAPIVRGRAPALAAGLAPLVRLTPAILDDLARIVTRRPRRYVTLAGRPGERAFVTARGAYEGWHDVAPEQGSTFENRVAAAALGAIVYDPSRRAAQIRCPLLVCVSDREQLMDPRLAVGVAERAPRGEVRRYPADHFEVYHAPLFDQVVADQVAFLHRHVGAAGSPAAAA